ncbi:hypothetical protein BJ138DRAFT_1237425 [Hygrophoropsis aurantiaca]|uniref:Uncharacterized protein n=1 Tax=Hygrophoropsis aurantiaca TaxID=72124 RepID=A0ACB8AFA1_9AGAM|nr:hypothetical protein BJ138DRAFT_1237425 [Hygrophoropsis aurantiaca]
MPLSFLSRLNCTHPGCDKTFISQRGRTKHIRTFHRNLSPTLAARPSESRISDNEEIPHPTNDKDPADIEMDAGVDHPMNDGDHDVDTMNGHEVPHRNKAAQVAIRRGKITRHPYLYGAPCDHNGNPIPPGTPPPARYNDEPNAWAPFTGQAQFLLADFLFRKVEMSAPNIDYLMELWAFEVAKLDGSSPFVSHRDAYQIIDSIRSGDVPWQCLSVDPPDNLPPDAPTWKRSQYQVWFRDPDTVIKNMLDNPDFDGQFDYAPYVYTDSNDKRRWTDIMSGNFAWRQCDKIYEDDPTTEGATYVGVVLGSDKTTVSVATGHVEYHPLYLSIGNPHNSVRRAHRNAVTPIAFLAIPKSDRKYDHDFNFRTFKRQLFHSSISAILQPLAPGMTTPVVRRCPDGHYRRIIYDLCAFIADYPEQVMLAGIVQNWCAKCTSLPENLDGEGGRRTRALTDLLTGTLPSNVLWDQYGIDDGVVPFTNDFPRADIHAILTPDLLHQVIKGTFKDHLVEWTGEYLQSEHGEARANEIMDDIDKRIAATPHFPGLRRFPHGRRFKQWTGDDSKALMKVYLPAIAEYVPPQLVQCLRAFLDFCYLVRRSEIDEGTLLEAETALRAFHEAREIFRDSGIRPTGFSLPRQHSLVHYLRLIQEYGAPNGLCSSITESRHITAVKRPWRRSSRFEALGQMLLTNQRLDKLASLRVELVAKGLLPPTHQKRAHDEPAPRNVEGDDDDNWVDEPIEGDKVIGQVTLALRPQSGYPKSLDSLALHINEPALSLLTHQFLLEQLNPDNGADDIMDDYPTITSPISVFHSAAATFFAPSDISGMQGMRREIIRSTPKWRRKYPRHDCVFVVEDEEPGMKGMVIGRVKLFFSFLHDGVVYPCALIDRFSRIGRHPDIVTGMWKVRPETNRTGKRVQSVIHLDTILRSAHLIPVFGDGPLPVDFHFSYSLDVFKSYYVNKYADHHSHEIAF